MRFGITLAIGFVVLVVLFCLAGNAVESAMANVDGTNGVIGSTYVQANP